MSLVRKFLEGGTPILYKFNDKDYNFSELERKANEGVNNYINTLSRGLKDYTDFISAYNDLLNGIKIGRVYYKDGRYIDTKGEYENKKKAKKDYYGLMANYIYKLQNEMNPYISSEEKSKLDINDSDFMDLFLRNLLFNGNRYDYDEFIKQDWNNELKQSDTITNRNRIVKDALTEAHNNFGIYFKGYTPELEAKWKTLLTNAINTLDGKLDENEYLALKNLTPNFNWRKAFSIVTLEDIDKQKVLEEENKALERASNFYTWADDNYPQYTGELLNYSLKNDSKSSVLDVEKYLKNLDTLDNNTLVSMLLSVLTDNDFVSGLNSSLKTNLSKEILALSILEKLKGTKYTNPNNEEVFYIPQFESPSGTGWVYNPTLETFSLLLGENILPILTNWYNEWLSLNGFQRSLRWANNPYILSLKLGGVLKFDLGGNVRNTIINDKYNWKDIIFKNPNFAEAIQKINLDNYLDFNNYLNSYYQAERYKGSSTNNPSKNDVVFSLQQTFNNLVGLELNEGAIEDAIRAGIITRRGNTGDNKNNGYADGYNGAMDELRHLGNLDHYNDKEILDFINSISNKNGLKAVLNPEGTMINWTPLDTQISSEEPETQEFDPILGPYGTITGKKVEVPEQKTNVNITDAIFTPEDEKAPRTDVPTDLFTRSEGGSNNPAFDWSKFGRSLALEGLDIARLTGSIHTNNDVSKILRESLKPYLRDTYERYSPVTGAFSTMLYYNKQASDVRRLGSLPYTSDASLNAARVLDANRQATDLNIKGFLTDDAEIKRTQQEALARTEDNMARRSEAANFNRQSINLTNREIAQLEASRRRNNWQSIDNYLAGVSSRLRSKENEREAMYNQFRTQSDMVNLLREYDEFKNRMTLDFLSWKRSTGRTGASITEWPGYEQYTEKLQLLNHYIQYKQYANLANLYGFKYNGNPVTMPIWSKTIS